MKGELMNPAINSAITSGSADVHSPNIETDRALNELYRKILEFDIDGKPVDFPFVRRLARENGWRIAYARQVVIEYKRFLFLAVAAGHPVSPSTPQLGRSPCPRRNLVSTTLYILLYYG